VFFFDATMLQEGIYRDSTMFLNLKKKLGNDSDHIVITISGNIHNQLYPYKDFKTFGYFISTYLSSSVLSVNHIYESGAMYNSVAGKTSLRQVNYEQETLKSISPAENYFYTDPRNDFSKQWNSFLFTTKINASYPAKND